MIAFLMIAFFSVRRFDAHDINRVKAALYSQWITKTKKITHAYRHRHVPHARMEDVPPTLSICRGRAPAEQPDSVLAGAGHRHVERSVVVGGNRLKAAMRPRDTRIAVPQI